MIVQCLGTSRHHAKEGTLLAAAHHLPLCSQVLSDALVILCVIEISALKLAQLRSCHRLRCLSMKAMLAWMLSTVSTEPLQILPGKQVTGTKASEF